jgi:hypothetical protein
MTQKWKTDESLYGAPTEVNGDRSIRSWIMKQYM